MGGGCAYPPGSGARCRVGARWRSANETEGASTTGNGKALEEPETDGSIVCMYYKGFWDNVPIEPWANRRAPGSRVTARAVKAGKSACPGSVVAAASCETVQRAKP